MLLLCLFSISALCQEPGSIDGTIVDRSGASIAGAKVKLSFENNAPSRDAVSGDQGRFTFKHIAPSSFRLSISATNFATQALSGIVHAGEALQLPPTVLEVAAVNTDVQVTLTQTEVAEQQIKAEEHQRLLGIIPNFDINYLPNAAPLTSKQKFELAWKTTFDPFTFVINGAIAGVQQARNDYKGFGQGAEGYAKRYGASYGSFVTGTMISSALLPAVLKQDPRYFYKGTGSTRERFVYAISRSVIRRSDNGTSQFNYSGILGNLAAGGISNFYYPAKDRNGAGVTFQNALIGIGADAVAHLFDEFVSRKLTTTKSKPAGSPKP